MADVLVWVLTTRAVAGAVVEKAGKSHAVPLNTAFASKSGIYVWYVLDSEASAPRSHHDCCVGVGAYNTGCRGSCCLEKLESRMPYTPTLHLPQNLAYMYGTC